MRNWFKKIGLSFATVVCFVCAAFGTAILLPETNVTANAATIAASDFYVSGAGVRLVNDGHGPGLRFHTRLTDAEYETLTAGNYSSGTLIIPEHRYDGELTLEDLTKESKYRPVDISTTGIWWDSPMEGFMQSTVYLYNIPEKAFGARYVARSYVTYADGTTVYSSVGTASMSDVAVAVQNSNSYSELVKEQAASYIVENVAVTYALPEGDLVQNVVYGSKLTMPEVEYDSRVYSLDYFTDQYGNVWDFETDVVTMATTLTPVFTEKTENKQVLSSVFYNSSNYNSNSSKYTVTSEVDAPDGYAQVTKYVFDDADNGWLSTYAYMSQTDISAYSSISFAMKMVGGTNFRIPGDDSNVRVETTDWVHVRYEQTSTNVWTMTTVAGETTKVKTGISGYRLYDLTKDMFYPNKNAEDTATIYSTEVATTQSVLASYMPSLDAEVIADRVMDTSGTTLIDNADVDVEAPVGFTTVHRADSGEGLASTTVPQSLYNNTDLSAYSEVWFALKMTNGFVRAIINWNAQYGLDGDWVYFHLTQTGEGVWTVEMTTNDGAKTFSAANQVGNNVKTLMYDAGWNSKTDAGGDGEAFLVYSNASGAGFSLYCTNIVGVLKEGEVEGGETESFIPSLADTVMVSSMAMHETNRGTALVDNADVSAVTIPEGFKSISRLDSSTGWASSALGAGYYSNVNLADYAEVWFALKLVNAGYSTQGKWIHDPGTWLYFHLKQDGTDDSGNILWDIVVKKPDGTVYVTMDNQSGVAIDGSRPANSVAKFMYNTGYNGSSVTSLLIYHKGSGVTASIYTTEIRGTRSATWGERAIWSAVDLWRPTTEAEIPNTYTTVYEKTNFAGGSDFAKYSLSKVPYNLLKFAFTPTANVTLNADGAKTLAANTVCNVTLTRTSSGWNVTVASGANSYSFTSTEDSLSAILSNIVSNDAANTSVYATEVRGEHGECVASKYTSLGNGTHQGYCACGEAVGEPVACTGTATCTEAATCTVCGEKFGEALGHVKAWVGPEYVCTNCGNLYERAFTINKSMFTDGLYTATTEYEAPKGYDSLTKYTFSSATNYLQYWSQPNATDLTPYTDVYFAIWNPDGGFYINGPTTGTNVYKGTDWIHIHLQQTSSGVWTLYANAADGYAATKTDVSGTTLRALMEKFYPNKASNEASVIVYSTEVRAWKDGYPYAKNIPANAEVIADRVVGASGTSLVENADLNGVNEPIGFSTVTRLDSGAGSTSGNLSKGLYNTTDLSGYGEVWFAIKHTGAYTKELISYKDYGLLDEWLYFHLIQGDGVWMIEMSAGSTVKTYTNQVGNTLQALLYDNGWSNSDGAAFLIYHDADASTILSLYQTEVLATVKAHDCVAATYTSLGDGTHQGYCQCGEAVGDPIACSGGTTTCEAQAVCSTCGGGYGEIYGGHIAAWTNESTFVCNRCGEALDNAKVVNAPVSKGYYLTNNADLGGETAPRGFSTITRFDSSSTWTSGALNYNAFDKTDLGAYSEVWFAMKLVNASYATKTLWQKNPETWIYFYLKQVGTDGNGNILWNIVAENPDGTTYFTVENQSGVKISDNQPANSLAALLYDASFSSTDGTYVLIYHMGNTASIYTTEIYGTVNTHTCKPQNVASIGDGQHKGICLCGREVVEDCTVERVDEMKFVCNVCNTTLATINTHPTERVVAAFYENATLASFSTATKAINISLASVLGGNVPANVINVSAVSNFQLDGTSYPASISNNQIEINADPTTVFGEYVATATVTIAGTQFDVEFPVVIATDLITTEAGFANIRLILRGADKTGTVDTSEVIGGTGGEGTMNGDGYYILGADVTLASKTYVFGTSVVPFVGTFDGNGYSLKNLYYRKWFINSNADLQDAPLSEEQIAAGKTLKDSVYGEYLEGSLFGVVNGKIKNTAITNASFDIFANLVHSGSGVIEDVYVQVKALQGYDSVYTAPFFTRGDSAGAGTLRNVVMDLTNADWKTYLSSTPSKVFPAAIGKCFVAENVAVYGFYKHTYSTDAAGNVYIDANGKATDGSAAGIYVTYTDGTNNGSSFSLANLHPNVWKIIGGKAILANATANATENVPANYMPKSTDANAGKFTTEHTTEYYIAWETEDNLFDTYEAARFIKEYTFKSTGATLTYAMHSGDPEDTSKKQIIVGTFDKYETYVGNHVTLNLADDGRANYGVYLIGNTFFVLGDTQEAVMYAAKEFARSIFGYNELAHDSFTYDVYADGTLALPTASSFNTTSQIAFSLRTHSNKSWAYSNEMGFSQTQAYTQYGTMHNVFSYFQNTDSSNTLTYFNNAKAYALDGPDTGDNTTDTKAGEQLCYLAQGDAAVFKEMVNHVVKQIVAKKAADPSMQVINFMIADDPDYCPCSACAKFSNPSITQLIFLNEVARALKTAGCNVGVEFFAYSSFAKAPVLTATDKTNLTSLTTSYSLGANTVKNVTLANGNNVDVLLAEEGLRLQWTSHKANHSYPLTHAANVHMYDELLAWIECVGAKNIDLFLYQTAYADYFLPLNTWEYQVTWYRELNALGINSYIFSLGQVDNTPEAQTAFTAFKTYIDDRAMTDTTVTFAELKNEFFAADGYYGAAGPTMRNFFEELVEVMEARKQGNASSFVALDTDGDYMNSAGYLNPAKFDYTSSMTNAYWRQSHFNGSYNLQIFAFAFPNASSTTLKGATDLYWHSKYDSQLLTLEAWYNYCQTALTEIANAGYDDATEALYQKRVNLEALFPEYAILMLHSTYKTTFKWSSLNGSYSSTGKVTPTAPETSIGVTYAGFKQKVDNFGITLYGEGRLITSTDMGTAVQAYGSSYGLYKSFFKNWGVV